MSKVVPVSGSKVAPEEDDAQVPGALTRSMSMKDHAKAAGSHYMQHKFKYIAAKVVIVIAVVLGCVYGIIKILALKGKAGSAAALIAGKAGTTIPSVSALPAKKRSSSRRRLVGSGNIIHDTHTHMLRGLSTVLNSPSSFDATSDYNTFGGSLKSLSLLLLLLLSYYATLSHAPILLPPSLLLPCSLPPSSPPLSPSARLHLIATNLVVGDKAVESVETINLIGCLTKQMRAMDVGLNVAYNPSNKPYVAIVDSGICGSNGGGIQTWAISVKGPSALGDGTYTSIASFTGFGGVMHVSFVNTVLNSTLLKSEVDFSQSSGGQIGMEGALHVDFTNPALTDVIFMQREVGQPGAAYLHATFNPTTFVGGVVSTTDGTTLYALDFNNDAINRRSKVGSAAATSVCFDYSPSKMLYAGEQYTLFNANDGSRKQLVQGYSGTFSKDGVTAPIYIGYWGLYCQDVYSADGKTTLAKADQVKDSIADGSSISVQKADGSMAVQKIQRVNAVLQKTSTQTSTLAKLKGVPLQVWTGSDSDTVAWTGTQFVRVAQDSYFCVYSDGSNREGSVTAVEVDASVSLATQMDAQTNCLCLDPTTASSPGGLTLKTTGSVPGNYWESAGYQPSSKTRLLDGTQAYPITAAKFPWGMSIYSGR